MTEVQYALVVSGGVIFAIVVIVSIFAAMHRKRAPIVRRRIAPKEIISERRFEITHRLTGDRTALTVIFWIWGLGYGFLNLISVIGASGLSALGVGTSAAVTMHICMWMGGLLLFGIGALLCRTHSTMRIHDPAPPDEGG